MPDKARSESKQGIKIIVDRKEWATFKANCKDTQCRPLASIREWINQFNDHCEATKHEATTN